MLRKLKRNKLLNLTVRNSFRLIHEVAEAFRKKVITRWDISGIVKVKVAGNEIMLFSECDDHCTRDLYYGLDWEKHELNVWTIFAEKSAVIFDIGANTGIYSILSESINSHAKIFAFEPNPINAARLRKNLEINHASNVTVVEKAVGDSKNSIKFAVPTSNEVSLVSSAVSAFTESFFSIDYKEIEVEQTSLNGFCESENLFAVDLIKIDVEYYEFNVLKGAKELLTKQSPVILCEIFMYEVLAGDKPDSPLVETISKTQAKEIQDFMSELGYIFYAVGERGLLRVDNLLSNADGGRNYVFSKKLTSNIYLPYSNSAAILTLLN